MVKESANRTVTCDICKKSVPVKSILISNEHKLEIQFSENDWPDNDYYAGNNIKCSTWC